MHRPTHLQALRLRKLRHRKKIERDTFGLDFAFIAQTAKSNLARMRNLLLFPGPQAGSH